MVIKMTTRPSILKETAQIKKENLVADTYTIANEDINEDEWYQLGKVEELKKYIISELNLNSDITLSSVDREWLPHSIQSKRNQSRTFKVGE